MIRILALVPSAVGISPGQRFRFEQWEPHLRSRHGISLDFLPFESKHLRRIRYLPGHEAEKAAVLLRDVISRAKVLHSARGYDGVAIHRAVSALGPAFYEHLLAAMRIPIVFDFDDAIWLPTQSAKASANSRFDALQFPGKTASICRLASAVSTGNEYLAAYARRFNDNVFVVPTSIELAMYPMQPERPTDGAIEIVWMGSFSTLSAHLETARSALERFARQRKVVVRVICDRPPNRPFEGTETIFEKWSADREAVAIGQGHIGIMPLPDDAFTRGKCGCKALQYMAAGRPVVLSPIGMNRDIARGGESAILASTEDEWVSALEALAASPELRTRLAKAGRRVVETGFSAEASAARFAEVIRCALQVPKSNSWSSKANATVPR